ncbi:hypothetical protein AXG93_2909s1030 [Marchantia polymorpha subsp. ruderalis]|uniref:Uncharacterized protein n=1 Tax=Marchantia polymorpha subsp. ruderalis TaxID=1480154 RepID=A0A176WBP5_MARPO|nr:hypothetical protein AXG93_2909s1030 [Marchantia polymorpha subsp. ruderalis]
MRRYGAIRLTVLRVPEAKLRAYRVELILAKLGFLLWGWNWKECGNGVDADPLTFSDNVYDDLAGWVRGTSAEGNQIHHARIFWTATRQHIGVLTGGSANYLSPA